ncbi:MAG: hypothetical protein H7248_03940 [Microbacteriaceae bacterium]|nr:hypothetical protein [Microbacteriaceae bacterium]
MLVKLRFPLGTITVLLASVLVLPGELAFAGITQLTTASDRSLPAGMPTTNTVSDAAASDLDPSGSDSTELRLHGEPASTSATITLSGTLYVTADESPAYASVSAGRVDGTTVDGTTVVLSKRPSSVARYAVQTAGGPLVTISGTVPEGTQSGGTFTGTVAVPTAVTAALPSNAAAEVARAVGKVALAQRAPISAEIFAAALEMELPLPISEATVAPRPITAVRTAPQKTGTPTVPERATARATNSAAPHNLVIVAVQPTDTTPSDYSDAMITAATNPAAAFWQTTSRGLISSFGENSVIRDLVSVNPCAVNPFVRWDEAVKFLGYADLNAFLVGGGHHLIVVLPAGCVDKTSAGVGTVGSALGDGGFLEFISGAGADKQTLIHELGHNFSLGHSNVDFCPVAAPSASCTEHEYADIYDAMGMGFAGFDGPLALNSRAQVALGFITVPVARRFALASNESQRSFSVTLNTVKSGADPITFEAIDPETGAVLYGEYRAEEPNAFYSRGYFVNFGTDRLRYLPGVRLLRGTGGNGSSAFSRPGADAGVNLVAAAVGQTAGNGTGSVSTVVSAGSTDSTVIVQVTLTRASVQPVAASDVYRFWSSAFSAHFYTNSIAERDAVIERFPTVWAYEGAKYKAFGSEVPGSIPLYRFWSARLRGHFYTASAAEKDLVVSRWPETWTYEKVAYWVYPLDTTVTNTNEVSRFWSDRFRHHFYTSDVQEREAVKSRFSTVWSFEGARFRVPV